MKGVLRQCAGNPRYFTDDSGKPIYLTGASTWGVFQKNEDSVTGEITFVIDAEAYFSRMQEYGHNFIRLWCMESSVSLFNKECVNRQFTWPMPYVRVGVREEDGVPIFDLRRLNDVYFDELRKICLLAKKYGIYVSVMLFEGWSVDTRNGYVFGVHPFHKGNNINGIDGEPFLSSMETALSGENDKNPFAPSEKIIVQTLENTSITDIQKAYVRRVIETLNDLDHVMYEICNEGLRWTRYWQYEMIRFIHKTEEAMPKQHPVWMSHLVPAQNESLWISEAEAVSPGVESTADDYCINPPAADGRKVILADTDHLGGIWGTAQWVWKSFLRGLNPLFMDDVGMSTQKKDDESVCQLFGRWQYGLPDNWEEPVRVALGRARQWADRIDLLHMQPMEWVSSTGYCLANPGHEYLIYQPESGQFKVRLNGAEQTFYVEWYFIEEDQRVEGKPFCCPMAVDFTPPAPGQVLLYLKEIQR